MTKQLYVSKQTFDTAIPELDHVSERLDLLDMRESIDVVNWESHKYKPEISFVIAYTNAELLLKYYITEEYFKAEMTESNQAVYEDSCVEFFISPENDGVYYNFEFNGIGTCLMGTGTSRAGRERAPIEIIAQIRRISSAGKEPVSERKGRFSWTLTTALPFSTFYMHKFHDPEGRSLRANFYKCGDKLTVPHYLTWNPVKTDKPDYHQPVFFGILNF